MTDTYLDREGREYGITAKMEDILKGMEERDAALRRKLVLVEEDGR